jgi:hypothetical protein
MPASAGTTLRFQEFVARVAEDLRQDRSILTLVPATVDSAEVRLALTFAMDEAYAGDVGEFWATETALEAIPAALGEYFDVTWVGRYVSRTVNSLADSEGLPSTIEVRGVPELSLTGQRTWLRFLVNWTNGAQSRALQGRRTPRLILLIPGAVLDGIEVASNVRLAIHWWWGTPSAVEMRLMCRQWYHQSLDPLVSMWREHLIPSLAGNDRPFAEQLSELVSLPVDDLIERLCTVALSRGWTKEVLLRAGADCLNGNRLLARTNVLDEPPLSVRGLWCLGALDYTPEYGLELHTLALVTLRRDQVVRHRYWRAQAALLLPRLDLARLIVCERFTDHFGRDWPLRWAQPLDLRAAEAVREDPLACEWGYLKVLVGGLLPLSSRDNWLAELVVASWQARNRLSHYQTVTYAEFERLWRMVDRLAH